MMEVVSGDSWSYKMCKSPPIYQHPGVYRPDALPVAQPTVSEQCEMKENTNTIERLPYC